MASDIEEIKNRVNVLEVISGYVKLTKTGMNWRGVCPFHQEKSPSFFVSPSRQMWHCFGCGAGSSVFDFIMKIEGIEFGDALRLLAEKAGVELKKENVQLKTERTRLQEILELACRFFAKQLEGGVGKEAERYLLDRGISQESIKTWRLGYSPDAWNALSDFLVGKGYERKEIVRSGLAIEKEGGRGDAYDRFRGRIMFPVFDAQGRVTGFGGRVFKQQNETAKYINTPQTLLYNKSALLYGLHRAKISAQRENVCVVTEGYTDVILCHQAGFENTVAASGTALTEQHLQLLKRYTNNLVLAFDMDLAGDSATKRGIHLAQLHGFNITVIENYEKNLDPADIIKKNPEIWRESLQKAKSIMDYYLDSALAKFDLKTPDGKREIGAMVLPAIARIQNAIEQAHWVGRLAGILLVKEETVFAELAKIPQQSVGPPAAPQVVLSQEASPAVSRRTMLEEQIFSLALKNQAGALPIIAQEASLFSPRYAALLALMAANNPTGLEKSWYAALEEGRLLGQQETQADIANHLAKLSLKGESESVQAALDEIRDCIFRLKEIQLKEQLLHLSQEIQMAEYSGNHEKAEQKIRDFHALLDNGKKEKIIS